MAHISPDFSTKKAAREALAAGKTLYAVQPGPFPLKPYSMNADGTGNVVIEAPAHYHKWYAQARIKADGRIVSLK